MDSLPTGDSPRRNHSFRSACLIGLVLLMVFIAVIYVVIRQVVQSAAGIIAPQIAASGGSSQDEDQRLFNEYGIMTVPLPGNADPSHFDPFAAYPQIVAFVGGDVALHSMEITYIRPDGTMDLNATYTPAPNAEYKFIRGLATPPPDAPPVGAGGGSTDWYVPVTVKIYKPGATYNIKSGLNSTFVTNKGMESDSGKAENDAYANRIPAPTCPFTSLWSDAISKGAPKNAVASISYDGGGYSFSMPDIGFFMHFNVKCAVTSVEGPRPTSTPRPQ